MIILGSRHFALYCNLLFFLLTGCNTTETTVIATVGSDVTLRCSYNSKTYGRLSACWGRGPVPKSGCANQVISSDGNSVKSRSSERYLLMGNLRAGDVSLTIRQVVESDSGKYGCRVEIPGWFNDQKHHVTLKVNAAHPNPLRIETSEVKERTITIRWTRVFDGGRPITSYRVDLKSNQTSWDSAVTTEVQNAELTQVTLVDLRPSKTYNIRMFAINSVGMSETSNVLIVTTKEAAPEGPPLDVQLEALSPNSIKVTWKPPRADLRNGVLRGYSLYYREYDPVGKHFKQWQQLSVMTTQELESITLKNLKPSTIYGVIIQAKTSAGVGPASTTPLCSTLDEVHETTAATTFSPTVATTWNGISFTSDYTTSATSTASPTSTALANVTAPATSAAAITSAASTILANFFAATVSGSPVPPDPPMIQLKEVSGNIFSLFWIAGYDGSSPITGYVLEYKAVNASWDYTKTVVDFSANQTEAAIIEINPSTYNIRMFAKNNMGTSAASNVLTITTGATGHQRDSLITTPLTSASYDTSHSGHLAAIIVPVVLVVLIGTTVVTWQLYRMKQKKGSLNMLLGNGGLRYGDCESLQEL